MSLVKANQLLNQAMKDHYAVPSFNANCFEMIPALIHAAEFERAPIIIQIGKKYLSYTPSDEISSLALYLAQKASIPVAIHLDHGADLSMVSACLKSGFTSIMYDGSFLPDDENIKNTKLVVEEASKYGVPVEGEIGQVLQYEDVSNGSEQNFLTAPEQAIRFVKETGVSSVAVAVGNIHHMKAKHAHLDFERIKALRETIQIPLVIHGCSGVSDEDLKKAIDLGINKVNVATEFNIAFTDTLREFTTKHPDQFFPMDAMTAAMDKITTIARDRIRVLGADKRYQ